MWGSCWGGAGGVWLGDFLHPPLPLGIPISPLHHPHPLHYSCDSSNPPPSSHLIIPPRLPPPSLTPRSPLPPPPPPPPGVEPQKYPIPVNIYHLFNKYTKPSFFFDIFCSTFFDSQNQERTAERLFRFWESKVVSKKVLGTHIISSDQTKLVYHEVTRKDICND